VTPVLLRSLRFQNFKGLRDFAVRLHSFNVLVGPNNAGKSTILDGLRAISAAIKFGRRRNPRLYLSSVKQSEVMKYGHL
jgi:predicted ATP-dependent endonuclease of OLD family